MKNFQHKLSLTFILTLGLFFIFNNTLTAQSYAGQGAKKGAGKGALLGALAGAVFGDGDVLDNAIEGAVIGASVGALSGAIEGGQMDKQEKEEFDKLVAAYGEDNIRGYIELLKCNHDKAIALFNVGKVSDAKEHQLAGLWLEAAAEKDRKDLEKVSAIVPELIEKDQDIDDKEMASLALNQIVLDLRNDRKVNQLPSCHY